jgi:hypothetical protein
MLARASPAWLAARQHEMVPAHNFFSVRLIQPNTFLAECPKKFICGNYICHYSDAVTQQFRFWGTFFKKIFRRVFANVQY